MLTAGRGIVPESAGSTYKLAWCMVEGRNRRTVEIEGMADTSQDDPMRHLCEEVILEIRIIHDRRGGIPSGRVAGRFEGDEFGNRDLLFETRETARWKVQFLDQDCLVHEAVPIHARLHVAFPLVKAYVVAR